MLEDITRKGTCAARKLKRAPILLKAAARWKDEALMEALDVSASMVKLLPIVKTKIPQN